MPGSSSKAPKRTLTTDGSFGLRLKSPEPQARRTSGEASLRLHARTCSSPAVIRNDPGATLACGDAAAPVRRWQRAVAVRRRDGRLVDLEAHGGSAAAAARHGALDRLGDGLRRLRQRARRPRARRRDRPACTDGDERVANLVAAPSSTRVKAFCSSPQPRGARTEGAGRPRAASPSPWGPIFLRARVFAAAL